MTGDVLSITSHTSAAFASATGRHDARDAYRAFYRAPTKEQLAAVMPIAGAQDDDGAIKFLLQRPDGLETESVILPQAGRSGRIRRALCVSSQVGCAMGCAFCETAQMGLLANLSTAEIIAQWVHARWSFKTPIDNIVFMGMGEPMDNFDAVLPAIRILADHDGPAIASSRIAVSTVGRTDGIDALTDLCATEGFRRLKLAVSINAPNDDIRREIMPLARAVPYDALLESMLRWTSVTKRRVLAEYVLIPGVNDDLAHADELAARLSSIPSTVNVIPYNPRRDSPWPAPTVESVDRFIQRLIENGQPVRRRRTIGRGVMAACGQLGNEKIRKRRWHGADSDAPIALSVDGRHSPRR
ncbi:MAG: 23S rRNA (adenine(2503)-C(2))-methyltransferase RlmN [Planctomycetota bacterium]